MYRIIDDRASGKTSRLMLLAKENNAKFVCKNPRAMETKAHAYGIIGINFISYSDFFRDMPGQLQQPIVIDELEIFVRDMIHHNGSLEKLIGYTISNED